MSANDEKWLETLKTRVESAPAELPEGGAEALCAGVARLQRRRRLARSFVALGSAAAAAVAIFLTLPEPAPSTDSIAAAVTVVDPSAYETPVQELEPTPSVVPAYRPPVGCQACGSTAAVEVTPSSETVATSVPASTETVQDTSGPASAPSQVHTPEHRTDLQLFAQEPSPAVVNEDAPRSSRLTIGAHLAYNDFGTSQVQGHQAVSSASSIRSPVARTAPYFSGYTRINEYHKPLNLGVSLSLSLNSVLSLETGLTYSYHRTDIHNYFHSEELGVDNQIIHFVGVPLGFRLTAFRTGRSSLYGYAGIMTQKSVQTTWNGDRLNVTPVVLSSHLSAGYQFAFTDFVGLYLEPGASHYDAVSYGDYTIYSQNPWQFELRAGLRFTM